MKKICTVFLVCLMLFTVGGCKKSIKGEYTSFKEAFDDGFYIIHTYAKGRRYRKSQLYNGKDYLIATYVLTENQDNLLKEANKSTDGSWYEKYIAVLETVENVKFSIITDQVPTQGELNKFVGKTIGDMCELGYMVKTLYPNDDGFLCAYLSNDKYSLCIQTSHKSDKKFNFGERLTTAAKKEAYPYVIDAVSFNYFERTDALGEKNFGEYEHDDSIKNAPIYQYLCGDVQYFSSQFGIDYTLDLYKCIDINKYIIFAADFSDELRIEADSHIDNIDYYYIHRKFLCSLKNQKVYDVTQYVLTDKEVNGFIGKTVDYLFNLGYKIYDRRLSNDNYASFYLSDGIHEIGIYTETTTNEEELKTLSDEKIKSFIINEVFLNSLDDDFINNKELFPR